MNSKIKNIPTFWKLFPLIFILITVLIFTVKYGVPIEFLLTILKSIVRPKVEFGMNGYFRFK